MRLSREGYPLPGLQLLHQLAQPARNAF